MSGATAGGWGEALAAAHAAINELVALVEKQDVMLDKMAEVLGRYTFTTVDDGEWSQDFFDDDVIGVLTEWRTMKGER